MAKNKESLFSTTHWLAYIASLPTDDPAARMRVLRTLESLGCAVVREGVFLLPDTPENRLGLSRLREHLVRIHGSATLLAVTAIDTEQTQSFQSLFDRTGKYEALILTVEGLKAGFGISDAAAIARILTKQRREFDAISAMDFFPSPIRDRAARVLNEAEEQVRSLMFPDAPKATNVTRSGRHFSRKIWATRPPLWADRLASAWLIRRFIDTEATIIWLDKLQGCPDMAIGFGFENAEFSNSKSEITFERLVASFDLNRNASLARIGALVHYLEAGGTPVAEAAGVETLLHGARRRSLNDDNLLTESEKTFDLLYDAYSDQSPK